MKKLHVVDFMGNAVTSVIEGSARDLRFITSIMYQMGHRQPFIQIRITTNTSTKKLERIQSSFY